MDYKVIDSVLASKLKRGDIIEVPNYDTSGTCLVLIRYNDTYENNIKRGYGGIDGFDLISFTIYNFMFSLNHKCNLTDLKIEIVKR